nr:MAG TPA: hypothetical protein [Caudoviricetes sp.]
MRGRREKTREKPGKMRHSIRLPATPAPRRRKLRKMPPCRRRIHESPARRATNQASHHEEARATQERQ